MNLQKNLIWRPPTGFHALNSKMLYILRLGVKHIVQPGTRYTIWFVLTLITLLNERQVSFCKGL
ncbi:hypothetical protein NITUZ_60189 [Candidatus Nitrosotenuis uzonensis]|uniref:Uncharacterized protein n=1 Tax=Candidatus Nitrosotenuis uzonensis TaxID=1407055 RepID=V6AVP3_9ARCH|nr:hypothetical protein NITUZ_60189 [Candidatus Nitrosotenuis uzonensis]